MDQGFVDLPPWGVSSPVEIPRFHGCSFLVKPLLALYRQTHPTVEEQVSKIFWGAMEIDGPWNRLRDTVFHRSRSRSASVLITSAKDAKWTDSWKRRSNASR